MPIKITLRKDAALSPFRHLLGQLLRAPIGDSAVLCSGYIWQPDDSSRYNVLDDGLRDMIIAGCSSGTLTTVAGKFYPPYYRDFYLNMVRDIRSRGITVTAYEALRKNWHAKVAIRLNHGVPVAALVGSSNLTGPAFGEGRPTWNYEADVMIWTASASATAYFRDDGIDQQIGKFETILDPDSRQPDEAAQLKGIYDDVMDSNLEEITE